MAAMSEKSTEKEVHILYEDENVLAVNKPAGLVVHSDGKTKEETLADWFISKYPEALDVGEPIVETSGNIIKRPGIVHRLDRDTSGVMLLAKNQKSFENLKSQFKDHKIEKKYHAFVLGKFKEKEGEVSRPIGRSSTDFRKWSAQRGARGELREALTLYKVLKENKGYSFIEVCPKTGRTHQIRVHMKAIDHPLLGDKLYSPKTMGRLGFGRTALHSQEVSFEGLDGEKNTVTAPYPPDFEEALPLLQS